MKEVMTNTIDHSKCCLKEELEALDLPGVDPHDVTMTAIVHAFKRKSFILMPGKHQGLKTAISRFQELNAAFLKVSQCICINHEFD